MRSKGGVGVDPKIAKSLQSYVAHLRAIISKEGDWSGTIRTELTHSRVESDCPGTLTLLKIDRVGDEVLLSCDDCGEFVRLRLQEVESVG